MSGSLISRLVKILVVVLSSLLLGDASPEWWQMGQTLIGEAAGDNFGIGTAMNADGTVWAVGSYLNDGGGADSGSVRVFSFSSGSWVQRGQDINGEAAGDVFGYGIALSDDGNIVASGGYQNDGAGGLGVSRGSVRCFAYNSGANLWVQRGADIDGVADYDLFGFSVAMSGDGTILAVGAYGADGSFADSGQVRVFFWGGVSWSLRGNVLNGEAASDAFGYSIALNTAGNILAVGAIYNDGNGANSGHVRVFSFSIGTNTWTQRGVDIDGEAAGDQFGFTVVLSEDGNVLASGADSNDGAAGADSGSVRVFAWSGTAWVKRGGDLDGEYAGDYFGRGLGISGDGLIVAGGSPINRGPDLTATARGHIRVFGWTGTTWEIRGDDIDGLVADDRYGRMLSMDHSGSIIGGTSWNSRANDLTATGRGTARAFQYVVDPTGQPSRQPSGQPTRQPSAQPSRQPSGQPSRQPSAQPSMQPSGQPTRQPSSQPSSQPTCQPSVQPSIQPTRQPSAQPSNQPSCQPTCQPSVQPSMQPSGQPTVQPSNQPSCQPTCQPSAQPSTQPSGQPTRQPSSQPSCQPTCQPSAQPSMQPSGQPTVQPSRQPSAQPSLQPSNQPSFQPTCQPSGWPSSQPSNSPSSQPFSKPSTQPTLQPSCQPSVQPSSEPSASPTGKPSCQPTHQPSSIPSGQPSSEPTQPTCHPSSQPSYQPIAFPTCIPSCQPTEQPLGQPTSQPSAVPTSQPSFQPSSNPSTQPSGLPSGTPTRQPTFSPTLQPISVPSSQPSSEPTTFPSLQPSARPSSCPTCSPSNQPSCQPSTQPSCIPTSQPSAQPTSHPSSFPSTQPTDWPSSQPTGLPTGQPSTRPSSTPSVQPTGLPTGFPSGKPSAQPSGQPTKQPTSLPSQQPSGLPSAQPTTVPSIQPSNQPSSYPTSQPSLRPSGLPSAHPSCKPSSTPSSQPISDPSIQPTLQPSSQPTCAPSRQPSSQPSFRPSSQPSSWPTSLPTEQPSAQPSFTPTGQPSEQPTGRPTSQPAGSPSGQPSSAPTAVPTLQPSMQPTCQPSTVPSCQPSTQPSAVPSGQPTLQPNTDPSAQPSNIPTSQPSVQPFSWPTSQPSNKPSLQPTSQPSLQPTLQPSRIPSSQPSHQPSGRPTCQPSVQPSWQPTGSPSVVPTCQPTSWPSPLPSCQPSGQPSSAPSGQPTLQPSAAPSSQPTHLPSSKPTSQPSHAPTVQPTKQPTDQPSGIPTCQPISRPTSQPSSQPTGSPSFRPTTQPSSQPSFVPTSLPSSQPSQQPSFKPSSQPTCQPSSQPTGFPSRQPSVQPSCQPTSLPSRQPSSYPTAQPSMQPTTVPTVQPTSQPSRLPSLQPTAQPSCQPSIQPSTRPSSQPTSQPSCTPSNQPSRQPTGAPTSQPSIQPSVMPSVQPSIQPSSAPSTQPTQQPTTVPSLQPSGQPTGLPSAVPSSCPSMQPTAQPTFIPSSQPSSQPSNQPSSYPTQQPSRQPSCQPSSIPSSQPSSQPTVRPSTQPSGNPSVQPSCQPSSLPTCQPSPIPSNQPTDQPTGHPTSFPSSKPSTQPSSQPTAFPSGQPSSQPSCLPSREPSVQPSTQPISTPSAQPTSQPSHIPSDHPSTQPSGVPTGQPTLHPSATPISVPTMLPSGQPTQIPSTIPSTQPSEQPFWIPTTRPTTQPSQQPAAQPTNLPTVQPSLLPTSQPSSQPSHLPSIQPYCKPSSQPTTQPSRQPSLQPSIQPSRLPTNQPSNQPSQQPTRQPTCFPSSEPSSSPSTQPTSSPTGQPSRIPSCQPSVSPTTNPSGQPSLSPSRQPSSQPSFHPSRQPSSQPSRQPTRQPSLQPTSQPSLNPTFPAPTPVPSTATALSNTALTNFSSLFGDWGSPVSLISDTFRILSSTLTNITANQQISVGLPVTEQEQALINSGQLTLPLINLMPNNSGNLTVAVGVFGNALWNNSGSSQQPLKSDIIIVQASDGLRYVDITFPVGAIPTSPVVNFTIVCRAGERKWKNYTCIDSGFVDYYQCVGVPGVYAGTCPVLQQSCSALDLTARALASAASGQSCVTLNETATFLTCRCTLGNNLLQPGTGVVAAGVVLKFVGSDFSNTFKAANALNSGGAASQASTMITLFSILWGSAVLLMLYFGVQRLWHYDNKSKSNEERTKFGPKALLLLKRTILPISPKLDSSKGDIFQKCDSEDKEVHLSFEQLMEYVESVFPPVFAKQSVLKIIANELYRHHEYINLLLKLSERSDPILDVFKMISMQSYLLFLLALLYDLNYPDDDGSCQFNTTQQDCLQRTSLLDPAQTYCQWTSTTTTSPIGGVTTGDGLCAYAQPQFSFNTALYISTMIAFATCIYLGPLEYAMTIVAAPDSSVQLQSITHIAVVPIVQHDLETSKDTSGQVRKAANVGLPSRSRLVLADSSQHIICTRRLGPKAKHFYSDIFEGRLRKSMLRRLLFLLLHNDELRLLRRKSLGLEDSEDVAGLCMDALEREVATQLSLLSHENAAAAALFCRNWGINANRKLFIRRRNVFQKTWTGSKLIPISPFALIQDELGKVESDVEEATEDLDRLTSEAERGFELLHLFIRDLLGRNTAASRIFMLKSELDFEMFQGTSWQLKVFVVSLIICLDGFLIYYAILKGFSKGLSWQADYVKAWGLQVSMDVVLFETVKCLWLHVIMPRMVAKEVQTVYHTVQDTVRRLFDPSLRSAETQRDICFNSAEFFFVSTRLARIHKDLVESVVVLAYSNHLPGSAGLPWQKQISMLYDNPQTACQKLCSQFNCSMTSILSLPLVPIRLFQSAALATIVRAPLAVQNVLIRMSEPLLLYACTYSFLLVKDNPLLLGVAVGAAVLLIGGLIWDSIRTTHSSTQQVAAESVEPPAVQGQDDDDGGAVEGRSKMNSEVPHVADTLDEANGSENGISSGVYSDYESDLSSLHSSTIGDFGTHNNFVDISIDKAVGVDSMSHVGSGEGKVSDEEKPIGSISMRLVRSLSDESSDDSSRSSSYGSSESDLFDSDLDVPIHTPLNGRPE